MNESLKNNRNQSLTSATFTWLLVLLMILLAGTAVWAGAPMPRAQEQEKAEARSKEEAVDPSLTLTTKVFTPQYILPMVLRDQLVALYRDQIRVTHLDDKLIVRTWPQLMPAVAEMIASLDTPTPDKKNIEITAYLVYASTEKPQAEAFPQVLQPVIAQLERTFNYAGYHLVESLLLRGQENSRLNSRGMISNRYNSLAGLAPKQSLNYALSCRHVAVQSVNGKNRISLTDFEFMCGIPSGPWTTDIMLEADLDVVEGQLAVVGKTSADGTPNALILILTARVVE
jgi:hypothetical protein